MTRNEDGHKITIFTIEHGAWRAQIDDRVLPCEWNSKGAANAGASVELRRQEFIK